MKKIQVLFFLLLMSPLIAEESYYEQAQKLFKQDRFENASEIVELLETEIATNRDTTETSRLLGIMYQQLGKYELALAQFERFEGLDSNSTDASVLYNKAICYYSLERYNNAKHILAVYSAFFMNSDNYKFEEFYIEVSRLARIQNLNIACSIIKSKHDFPLTDYLFMVIDENNYNDCKKDSEVAPFVSPQLSGTHGWMNILLIPHATSIQNRVCLYFNWEKPESMVSVDVTTIQGTSIEKSNEIIEDSRTTFSTDFISRLNLERIPWQAVRVTTDSGIEITAYTIVE